MKMKRYKLLLIVLLIVGCAKDAGSSNPTEDSTCVIIEEWEYGDEQGHQISCVKNMPESQCLPYHNVAGEIVANFIVEWYNDITCEEYCEQAEDGCQVEFDWDAYCDANPDRPDCD